MNAPAFDPATAYLVAGLLYVAMPTAAWMVLGKSRTVAASVWCLGSLLFGCGSLLLAFRGDWPGWLAFGVLNACFYSGNVLHVVALRLELGRRTAWLWAFLVPCLMLFVQEYCRLVLGSAELRLGWMLLANGTLFGLTAWLAWQVAQKDKGTSARWLVVVYVLGAVSTLERSFRVLLGMTSPDPLVVNWDSVLTTASMFVMSVFGSVALVGLYLERSVRRHVANEVAMQSQKTSQLLGQQIADLDRQRSMGELAGAMAHELAQPLTVVSVELGLLRHELKMADASVLEQVEKINFHVGWAANVLKGIRNFIQPAEPDFKPVNLLEVVHAVLQLLPTSAHDAQVLIRVRTDALKPMVMGDVVQLSQVLLNVLRNAVQAQAPGKSAHIEIHVQVADERWHVVIQDDGPGFPAKVLSGTDMAFSSTKQDGMGIGLSISRRIAKQHGGALILGNRTDAQGARVVLELPVAH
jgi:signal transduction histidine kinase